MRLVGRWLALVVVVLCGLAAFGAGVARASTVPGAPTNVKASDAINGQARVAWTAPASNGGATITKYTVTASGKGGQTCTWKSGALLCYITGLVSGTSYTFTVTATNSVGTGPASAASNNVTALGPPPPPTNVSAVAGDQQAAVSCTTPATSGGLNITAYTATASPGGAHASAGTCAITVTGLTDGTAYTFTVTATNSLGTSVASVASNTVTPVDTHPPAAPAGLAGRISGNSLTLTWPAATDNVGVDHYEIYLGSVAIVRVAGPTTTATLRAFARKGASVYTVRAFDAAGNESGPSRSVTARPVAQPKSVPKNLPGWAWKLLAWQERGQKGARPETPKHLPAWYADWKRWRLQPFRLVS